MSAIYYTLGDDYSASNSTSAFTQIPIRTNVSLTIVDLSALIGSGDIGFICIYDKVDAEFILQSSSSITSDLFDDNAGYLFDFSDNANYMEIYGGAFGDVMRGGAGVNGLVGFRGDDTIYGGGGDDFLFGDEPYTVNPGYAGNDVLNGGPGADFMVGDPGDDVFYVDNVDDGVIEREGEGTDRVRASIDYTLYDELSVEILSTTSSLSTGAIDLTGNDFAQVLQGNASANRLDGHGGADTLQGFAGDDTYFVDNVGDRVFEVENGGRDQVFASSDFTLTSNQHVERLSAQNGTSEIDLTGNALAQSLYGNDGDNWLNGRGGVDNLTGGEGSDGFLIDVAPGVANRDFIRDFTVGEDAVVLDRRIFSELALDALSADSFKVIGVPGARLDADDRILYSAASGNLFYDADGSGTGYATEVFATLTTKPDIDHTAFIVV